jgi:pimeloyl-ACP methyl ester carboxylesterase
VGGFCFLRRTQLSERIETLNGVELYFEIHGSGEPLVLLHGFSGCSQDWSPLIAGGSPHFQLIAPDMRGHGRSGVLRAPFRHRDAAADIFALLDHLGIGAFKGLGVSGGGNVLLHLAAQQPERVQAMVLATTI